MAACCLDCRSTTNDPTTPHRRTVMRRLLFPHARTCVDQLPSVDPQCSRTKGTGIGGSGRVASKSRRREHLLSFVEDEVGNACPAEIHPLADSNRFPRQHHALSLPDIEQK